MSSPTYIKVSFQGVTRRVRFQDWPSFEQQLHSLFEVPSTQRIHLAYKDADDDVISLSTETELRELIASTEGTVRLSIQLGNGAEDWVMEGVETPTVASTPAEPAASTPLDTNYRKPYVIDVPDEDARPVSSSSSNKGKAPEHSTAEAGPSTSSPPTPPPANKPNETTEETEDTPPFVKVAQDFSALLDSFSDVIEKNPQLTERFNSVFDQILKAVPIDLSSIAEQLGNLREQQGDEKTTEQQQNPFANHPFAPFLGALGGGGFGGAFGQHPFAAAFGQGHGRGHGPCGRKSFQGCPQRQPQEPRQPLSQEQLDEKLKTLHSMGFWQDDEQNKDLLNRYGGNVERVVEVLLRA